MIGTIKTEYDVREADPEDADLFRTVTKTREFSAEILGYLVRDKDAKGKEASPALLIVTGTVAGLRPFVANVRMGGTKIAVDSAGSLVMRSGRYREIQRPVPGAAEEAVVVTFYDPDLFEVESFAEDRTEEISFILLQSPTWLSNTHAKFAEHVQRVLTHLRMVYNKQNKNYYSDMPDPRTERDLFLFQRPEDFLGYVYLFSLYMEKRVPLPYPRDPAFVAQLLHACLRRGRLRKLDNCWWARFPVTTPMIVLAPECREMFAPGLYFTITQKMLLEVLEKEVEQWYALSAFIEKRGET